MFFGAKKVFFGSKKGAWRKFWSFLHLPKDCQLLPPCLALLWSMGAISLFPPFWRLWAQDSQSAGRLEVLCHPDQGSAREAHCLPQVQPMNMIGDDGGLTFWPQWLGVFDTLSDSIQCLNFAKKMIHSIFDSISLYPRFNSKYYSIPKKICLFNSKDNSIQ